MVELKSGAVLGMPHIEYDEALDILGIKLINDYHYTRRMSRAEVIGLVERTFDNFDRLMDLERQQVVGRNG